MQSANNYITETLYNPALLRPIPISSDIPPEEFIAEIHNIFPDKKENKPKNFLGKENPYKIYIAHKRMNGKWEQEYFGFYEALNEAKKRTWMNNQYISMNSFKFKPILDKKINKEKNRIFRQIDNLASLNSIYIDIDCGFSLIDEYLDKIFSYISMDKFPLPNIITHSGNGIHLIYLINPIPLRDKMDKEKLLSFWRAQTIKFCDFLENQGIKYIDKAASTDPARVLRLPQTHNIKQISAVIPRKKARSDLYRGERYDLRKICSALPTLQKMADATSAGRSHTTAVESNILKEAKSTVSYSDPIRQIDEFNNNADLGSASVGATGKNTKKYKKIQKIDYYASDPKKPLKSNSQNSFEKEFDQTILHKPNYRVLVCVIDYIF